MLASSTAVMLATLIGVALPGGPGPLPNAAVPLDRWLTRSGDDPRWSAPGLDETSWHPTRFADATPEAGGVRWLRTRLPARADALLFPITATSYSLFVNGVKHVEGEGGPADAFWVVRQPARLVAIPDAPPGALIALRWWSDSPDAGAPRAPVAGDAMQLARRAAETREAQLAERLPRTIGGAIVLGAALALWLLSIVAPAEGAALRWGGLTLACGAGIHAPALVPAAADGWLLVTGSPALFGVLSLTCLMALTGELKRRPAGGLRRYYALSLVPAALVAAAAGGGAIGEQWLWLAWTWGAPAGLWTLRAATRPATPEEPALSLAQVELGSFVREVAGGFCHLSAEREVRLVFHGSRRAFPVMLDPARFKQVLGTIVANALEFTAAGGDVAVRVDGTDAEGEVAVVANGDVVAVPLSAGTRRLPASEQRRIIAAHGGALTSETDVLEGTRILITLPLHCGIEPAAVADR